MKYGVAEARLVGALRVDGVLRGLGGIIGGTFTTAQRDAIPAAFAQYGMIILNTTLNQYEWNKGTDAVRNWIPVGVDPIGSIILSGGTSTLNFTNQNAGNYILKSRRGSDGVDRFAIREDGQIEWGSGAAARDILMFRNGTGQLVIRANAGLLVETSDSSDGRIQLGGNTYVARSPETKLLIQYGLIHTLGGGGTPTTTVIFPVPYAEAPMVVVSGLDATADANPGRPVLITNTQFKMGSFQPGDHRWIAVGKAS